MTDSTDIVEDPWAWLHAPAADDAAALATHLVTVLVLAGEGAERTEAALDAVPGDLFEVDLDPDDLAAQSLSLATESTDEWLWFLPAGAQPSPTSLAELLRAALRGGADVVGPLLLQPRRRHLGSLVAEFGQTVTTGGRRAGLAEPGEPYQGQLATTPVLGLGLTGLLVRRTTFLELGGFVDGVPPAQAGLEFCWRANLAGHPVLAVPAAQVVHRVVGDDAADRRWGLALASAHGGPGGPAYRLRLVVGALLSALGYLLGKDPGRARAELVALGGWLGDRAASRRLRTAVAAVTARSDARRRVHTLRPGFRAAFGRVVDGVAGRVADWSATFTDRAARMDLDELTGDDFASRQATRRLSPVLVGGVLVVVLALVAGRTMFGLGSLVGPQLLPAQAAWGDLLADYLRPLPGLPGVAAPSWLGLTALGALLTLGHVDALVTLVFLLCVPVGWFAAFRLLRRLLDDGRVALVGGFFYALAPALVGGLNRGMFGLALWAALLPVLGYAALEWWHRRGWREAGAAGLLLTLATSLVPLIWAIALVAAVAAALVARRIRAVAQLLLALAAPGLLFLGPGFGSALAFPGRLLTGTDPALGPVAAAQPWLLALGQSPGGGLPPLWLAGVVFGTAWLAALVGALRRPRTGGWALLGGAVALTLAVALSRLVVLVAPGTLVRPQVQPWLVVMVAALVIAGATGLDGLGAELSRRALGTRHLLALGLTILTVGAAALAAGWWAWDGQTRVHRETVGNLPAFVRNAQTGPAPSRTLAIELAGGDVRWALLEDDLPRLGDAERGIAAGGDPEFLGLAASVATRLVTGSADDQLVPDLTKLGVGNVWLRGSDADVRTAISNVPGLGTGTGDDAGATWPVPGSARAVVVDGQVRTPVGDGSQLAAGSAARTLVLAEPDDPRWHVTHAGLPLAATPGRDGRPTFTLPAEAGPLGVELDAGSRWWAWAQLAGLLVLIALSLPGLRRRDATPARAPARAAT